MDVYARLMAEGEGDPFDRHLFACILAIAASETQHPLTEAAGLPGPDLKFLLDRYFAGAGWLLARCPAEAGTGADAIEEPDLRQLLLDHASAADGDAESWLAAMLARRSLRPNHLWQDLGLTSRRDLSGLMTRHFRTLAEANVRDMKWKKFFYRTLCEREGIVVCKSPTCDQCSDFQACYGNEDEGAAPVMPGRTTGIPPLHP